MSDRKKEVVSPDAPPPLGTYSQAISSAYNYKHVYLSGSIPLKHDRTTGNTSLISGSIEEQAVQVFTNMKCKPMVADHGEFRCAKVWPPGHHH